MSLRITISVNDAGYLEQHVHGEDVGTIPAAMMVLYLNPGMPNAFSEYEQIAEVFTEEFIERLQEAMNEFASDIELSPDEERQVQDDVKFVLYMNGLTSELQILKGDDDDL